MKRGFTLIELLVYMAILGFIIVVAGRVFSDSTSMRIRSQNMLKTSEAVGRISNLIMEDISQMGAKAWVDNSTGLVSVDNGVYMNLTANPDNGDISSYNLQHRVLGSDSLDKFVFRKVEFNDQGEKLGLREISWEANANGELHRACRTIGTCVGDECSACPTTPTNIDNAPKVLIATNVRKFVLNPSVPGIQGNAVANDTLLGKAADPEFKFLERKTGTNVKISLNIAHSDPSVEATVSNFAINDMSNAEDSKKFNQVYLTSPTAIIWSDCQDMNFKKGETYVVEFAMPFPPATTSTTEAALAQARRDSSTTQFLPGIDHFAVGLRNKQSGNTVPGAPTDILFYPPQSGDAASLLRRAEFSVNNDINACLAITFAFYSPKANLGKLIFRNFKVFRKAEATFRFPRPADPAYVLNYGTEDISATQDRYKQKKNVKAFELRMDIEYNGEKTSTYSGNGNGMVILTPNNGILAEASAPSTP
jgi:prepilin-type N-terminal cleavage/methylation domain-containing protein